MIKNVISVIDGAAGSCGKAKVVGEIALDKTITVGASVTNCMPNAGHTFVSEKGEAFLFRNIPVATMNPKTELFIGPGSAIDMETFLKEYTMVEPYLMGRKIYVHEMVPLIEQRHKDFERSVIKSGSTFKGCGAVTQEKVMRDIKLRFFQTFRDAVVCSNEEWLERLYKHLDNPLEYVLLEGAQGCDLDLNHSGNYPYVTSRNVSTAQLLADSGISPECLLQTIMVIRPFPIRISNITRDGNIIYTGDYGTGDELKWTQVNLASMYQTYPFQGDVLQYLSNDYTVRDIKKLVSHCPEIYLKQLFGENYRAKKLDSLTLLEVLELERLVQKAKNQSIYETRFLYLPMFSSDYPPNTIIDQSEQTSVTRMERRIFDLDIKKLCNNCRINTPSSLYLNFFQHLGIEYTNARGDFEQYHFPTYLDEYFTWLEEATKTEISVLGTGAKTGEYIVKKQLIKEIS